MSRKGAATSQEGESIYRIPPYYYIHVLDQNTNVTKVEVGPKTFIRQDNEKVTVLTLGLFTCSGTLVNVVVNFLFQLIYIFPLFWGMVMYANEFKTKEKQKLTEIKN